MKNAYRDLPSRAFWRPAVADLHPSDWTEIVSDNFPVFQKDTRVATAGSCFAQHIGRRLRELNCDYLDYEPAPPSMSHEMATALGYGLYSARYGNVYTPIQLEQLVAEALCASEPRVIPWSHPNGGWIDALRPSVVAAHDDLEAIYVERALHVDAVRRLLVDCDVFVFTLGLTEAWLVEADGLLIAVPSAPGVIAGDAELVKAHFRNLGVVEVRDSLLRTVDEVRRINPTCKFVLTVSPVPLTATASGEHVLVATCRSKAALRAAVDEVISARSGVFYFPSFELITSHATHGMYFNPDARTVSQQGVDTVMKAFVRAAGLADLGACGESMDCEVVCDEDEIWRTS